MIRSVHHPSSNSLQQPSGPEMYRLRAYVFGSYISTEKWNQPTIGSDALVVRLWDEGYGLVLASSNRSGMDLWVEGRVVRGSWKPNSHQPGRTQRPVNPRPQGSHVIAREHPARWRIPRPPPCLHDRNTHPPILPGKSCRNHLQLATRWR